jgi:hypothetical protein
MEGTILYLLLLNLETKGLHIQCVTLCAVDIVFCLPCRSGIYSACNNS